MSLENGEKPIFHISVDLNFTRAEEAITNEQERLVKRKEFQRRRLAGACVTKAEMNANDRTDLKDKVENDKRIFPPTTMSWTTIENAKMRDVFSDATGVYPEEEEEEFLCRAEAKKFNLWADGKTGDKMEAGFVDGKYSMYRPECHDM